MGAGHYILRFYELLCKFAEGLPGYSLVLGRPSPGSLVMYFGIHGMGTAVVLFCIRGRSAFIRADVYKRQMLRYITNQGMQNLASMTAGIVIRIGGLYLLLRIIDSLAAYYMAYTGHVMGVYIETDMRQDAFEHLQMLSDSYYSNTKVGQIMSRITSDLFDVTEFAHHCPEEFFIACLLYTSRCV